jgi:hypothetical protein
MGLIIVGILVLAYIGLNFYVDKRIREAHYLSLDRKKLHRKFIWILPFLGPWLIRSFWKKPEGDMEVMTKDKRKLKKSDFYESGYYLYGD